MFERKARVLLWQWSDRLHGRKKVLSMNEPFISSNLM